MMSNPMLNFHREPTKFRNASNKRLVKALFVEYAEDGLYTLDNEDRTVSGRTVPSLKRLYLELEDLTEYQFATTYLEDWAHFEQLLASPLLGPYILQWRKELQLKIKSESLARLLVRARTSEKDYLPLNKYLIEGNWEEKSKAGRPTKKAIAEQAQIIAESQVSDSDDYDRLLGSGPSGLGTPPSSGNTEH